MLMFLKRNEKINDKLRLNAPIIQKNGNYLFCLWRWRSSRLEYGVGNYNNTLGFIRWSGKHCAKIWQLDRRVESFDKPKEINNSVNTFIFREFNVHYYTCQESDKIADYNESYRRNRVFLGDYRFIDGEQDEQLIPKEANLEVNREWTEDSKTIFLNRPTMVKKWLWCQGK